MTARNPPGRQPDALSPEWARALPSKRGKRLRLLDSSGVEVEEANVFLERLRLRGLSVCTIETYAYDLVIIHRWLEEMKIALSDISIDDVFGFIAWERGRGIQPKSINRRLHTLRSYYASAIGQSLPGGDEVRRGVRMGAHRGGLGVSHVESPATQRLRIKEPKKIVEPLGEQQVRDLVRSFRRYRDLCVLYFMLLCGLRTQEVLNLRLDSVDVHNLRLHVHGKGNKERAVPMPPFLIDVLQQYLALERPADCTHPHLLVVLQGPRRGQPMTRAGLRTLFRSRRKNIWWIGSPVRQPT